MLPFLVDPAWYERRWYGPRRPRRRRWRRLVALGARLFRRLRPAPLPAPRLRRRPS